MKILLKSCKIIDKSSPFHLATKDLLIEGGIIKDISDKIDISSSVIHDLDA